MERMTPEEANAWIDRFISDEEWPEQSSSSENSAPQEETHPLSWSEFLSILSRYCEHRGWELISDDPTDCSLIIFGPKDQTSAGREPLQEHLLFSEEDALPF
jgi:hypothetical protein